MASSRRAQARFQLKRDADSLVARSAKMLIAMEIRAERIASAARDIAPVETGDYKAGIEAVSGIVDGVATGRVNARDFKSHWVEFGTVKQPARAVLRRAVDSVGLHLIGGRGRGGMRG